MTDRRVRRLLDRHGSTFAAEIGIDLARNTPAPLFQWLVASLLFSARISAGAATSAARALIEAGFTTPEKMRDAGWEARVRVLNTHGYARYDEKTSTMLGEAADLLLDRWRGDLRRLREEAGRDPARERRLLQEVKGIGPTGAAIFAREAQDPWPELFPFADGLALRAAAKLGLPEDAGGLAALVPREQFTRLVAALARCELAKDHAAVTGKGDDP